MTQPNEQPDLFPSTSILRRIALGSFALVSVLCLAAFVTLGVGSVTHAETGCGAEPTVCAMPIDAIAR